MFTDNSYLVKLYVRKVKEEGFAIELVPNLYNLIDVVTKIVNR